MGAPKRLESTGGRLYTEGFKCLGDELLLIEDKTALHPQEI
jgi:hypothetical protein